MRRLDRKQETAARPEISQRHITLTQLPSTNETTLVTSVRGCRKAIHQNQSPSSSLCLLILNSEPSRRTLNTLSQRFMLHISNKVPPLLLVTGSVAGRCIETQDDPPPESVCWFIRHSRASSDWQCCSCELVSYLVPSVCMELHRAQHRAGPCSTELTI